MITVLINAGNRRFRVEEPLQYLGYTTLHIPSRGSKISRIIQLMNLIKKEHPDLFIIDAPGLIFIVTYIISRIFNIPFAARMRGNIWDVFSDQKTYMGFPQLLYRFLLLKCSEYVLRRVDRVFPVSQPLAEAIEEKGILKHRIRVLQFPIDHLIFCPKERKNESITLLSITNLSFRAKFTELIRLLPAIDRILSRHESVHYIIIGSGKFSVEFEEAIHTMKTADRIHYLGYQTGIPRFFQESDIFLHFSRLDGFPGAVIEAMSSELPVVANRYEAMVEQIDHGVTGFLIEDESSLHDTLELLITNQGIRKQIGHQARARIIEQYNMDTVANQFKNEIQELLREKRG
jgi:glycosyltransferase involved in cell wall biosynthesis